MVVLRLLQTVCQIHDQLTAIVSFICKEYLNISFIIYLALKRTGIPCLFTQNNLLLIFIGVTYYYGTTM